MFRKNIGEFQNYTEQPTETAVQLEAFAWWNSRISMTADEKRKATATSLTASSKSTAENLIENSMQIVYRFSKGDIETPISNSVGVVLTCYVQ